MTTTTTLLALLFLLFAFIIKPEFAIAGDVSDTDGNVVQNGGEYYILAGFSEKGGGVTCASVGVGNPLAVVVSASQNSLGFPVSISDSEGTKVILTDDTISLKFTNKADCNNSDSWMGIVDESSKKVYIGIGNANDYPSHQFKTGSFQIKEYNRDYKLIFCSDGNASSCDDVGIYVDGDGNSRLALNEGTFSIKFKNANKAIVT